MRLEHDRGPTPGPSPFGSAWHEFRSRLSGPIGCLVAILCLPFALIALLVFVCVALWKAYRLRNAIRDQVASVRATDDALPVAMFVRMFAGDRSFSREEATQAAVPASSGRSAAELLDDAIARDWVEEFGGELAVTDLGREQADSILRARGM